MAVRHINQAELAERWNISHRTLERWRWLGQGPRFVKFGGLVRYRLVDIELFETEQLRQVTGASGVPPLAAVATRPVGQGGSLVDNGRTEQTLMAGRGRPRG